MSPVAAQILYSLYCQLLWCIKHSLHWLQTTQAFVNRHHWRICQCAHQVTSLVILQLGTVTGQLYGSFTGTHLDTFSLSKEAQLILGATLWCQFPPDLDTTVDSGSLYTIASPASTSSIFIMGFTSLTFLPLYSPTIIIPCVNPCSGTWSQFSYLCMTDMHTRNPICCKNELIWYASHHKLQIVHLCVISIDRIPKCHIQQYIPMLHQCHLQEYHIYNSVFTLIS